MVRRKIKIKRIEEAAARKATFHKRRLGLLKKAHDLSVLCGTELALLLFSNSGKLYHFANPSVEIIFKRYKERSIVEGKHLTGLRPMESSQQLLRDIENEKHKLIQDLDTTKIVQGIVNACTNIGDLGKFSLNELHELECHMQQSLGYIRAQKDKRFLQCIEELRDQGNGSNSNKINCETQHPSVEALGLDGICFTRRCNANPRIYADLNERPCDSD